jgi:hypothetical protein
MRHPFQTYTLHMRYTCEACRHGIVLFWIASECPRERAYDEMSGSDPVTMVIVKVISGSG